MLAGLSTLHFSARVRRLWGAVSFKAVPPHARCLCDGTLLGAVFRHWPPSSVHCAAPSHPSSLQVLLKPHRSTRCFSCFLPLPPHPLPCPHCSLALFCSSLCAARALGVLAGSTVTCSMVPCAHSCPLPPAAPQQSLSALPSPAVRSPGSAPSSSHVARESSGGELKTECQAGAVSSNSACVCSCAIKRCGAGQCSACCGSEPALLAALFASGWAAHVRGWGEHLHEGWLPPSPQTDSLPAVNAEEGRKHSGKSSSTTTTTSGSKKSGPGNGSEGSSPVILPSSWSNGHVSSWFAALPVEALLACRVWCRMRMRGRGEEDGERAAGGRRGGQGGGNKRPYGRGVDGWASEERMVAEVLVWIRAPGTPRHPKRLACVCRCIQFQSAAQVLPSPEVKTTFITLMPHRI